MLAVSQQETFFLYLWSRFIKLWYNCKFYTQVETYSTRMDVSTCHLPCLGEFVFNCVFPLTLYVRMDVFGCSMKTLCLLHRVPPTKQKINQTWEHERIKENQILRSKMVFYLFRWNLLTGCIRGKSLCVLPSSCSVFVLRDGQMELVLGLKTCVFRTFSGWLPVGFPQILLG